MNGYESPLLKSNYEIGARITYPGHFHKGLGVWPFQVDLVDSNYYCSQELTGKQQIPLCIHHLLFGIVKGDKKQDS